MGDGNKRREPGAFPAIVVAIRRDPMVLRPTP